MRSLRILLIVAVLGGTLPALSRADAPVVAKGFDAYAIVRTRNIFDPNRVPVFATYVAPPPRIVRERPRRSAELITLTGIMIDGGQAHAFFFGSGGDRVLGVNGAIANAKVAAITASSVDLVQNGKTLTVPVGRTISYDNSTPGGSLTLAAPGTSSGYDAADGSSSQAAAPPPSDDSSQPAAPLPGNLNEVMKRMMERRQKELQ
jgi:hypothetical protein